MTTEKPLDRSIEYWNRTGCDCPTCTGLPAEHPAHRLPQPTSPRTFGNDHARLRWDRQKEAARHLPIVEVASRLGWGEPVRRGRELVVRCPLHEDRTPSCRLNPERQVWFCDPCGRGGDAIDLYGLARRIGFVEAVRELVTCVAPAPIRVPTPHGAILDTDTP